MDQAKLTHTLAVEACGSCSLQVAGPVQTVGCFLVFKLARLHKMQRRNIAKSCAQGVLFEAAQAQGR